VTLHEALKTAQDNQVRSYLNRSRLLVPNAFPLPEISGNNVIFEAAEPDETLLFGRTREVRDVVQAVHSHSLMFLYGESGSGKSSLLKLGVARELKRSSGWIPIYIDTWGQDWVRGPRISLANATEFALRSLALSREQPVNAGNVFPRLPGLRKITGRQPVLIFDQLDDYQSAYRTHFQNANTGLLISSDELCKDNAFWQDARQLILNSECPVHVLLATREDAKTGLHCFQFVAPGVYPLGRLHAEEARQLIHRLADENVVSKPENGFRQLVERIVAELGRDYEATLLPMQLRVAMAGIGNLTGPLTPS
jgi:hypothetical protein